MPPSGSVVESAVALARRPDVVTRVKSPVPAASTRLVSRAVRCPCIVVCRSVGFISLFAKEFETVNVERLGDLAAGTVVTDQSLAEAGIVSRIGANGVKILGHGDLGVALHVRVSKLSRSAAQKIMAAGGTIEGPVPGS